MGSFKTHWNIDIINGLVMIQFSMLNPLSAYLLRLFNELDPLPLESLYFIYKLSMKAELQALLDMCTSPP